MVRLLFGLTAVGALSMFIACSSSNSESVAKVPEKKEPENKEPPPPKGKDGKGSEHPPLIPPFVREGLKLERAAA